MKGRLNHLRATRARYAACTAVDNLCKLLEEGSRNAADIQGAVRQVHLTHRHRGDVQILLAIAGTRLYKLGIGRFGPLKPTLDE